jgi:hypothetical protein
MTTMQHQMHTLDRTGDQRVMWNSDHEEEVAAARDTFKRLVKAGYLAYRAQGKKGEQGEQIREFDPAAERIILVRPHQGG